MAVAISGSDRTGFILDAACKKAEEVILNQRLLSLASREFEAFEQALLSNPVTGKRGRENGDRFISFLFRSPK